MADLADWTKKINVSLEVSVTRHIPAHFVYKKGKKTVLLGIIPFMNTGYYGYPKQIHRL